MNGSGLLVLNAPWQLDTRLAPAVEALRDGVGRTRQQRAGGVAAGPGLSLAAGLARLGPCRSTRRTDARRAAKPPDQATGLKSGSKKLQRTSGNACFIARSTALICVGQRARRCCSSRMCACTDDHHLVAQLQRDQADDARDLRARHRGTRASGADASGSTLWPISIALTSTATNTATTTSSAPMAMVPIASHSGLPVIDGQHDRDQREHQAQQRGQVLAEDHHQFGLAALAEPLPQRTRAARLVDLDAGRPASKWPRR